MEGSTPDINGTNLYLVEGEEVTASSSTEPVTSDAICDEGDIVIEGGYIVPPIDDGLNNVLVNTPILSVGGTPNAGYIVKMLGEGNTFQAHAFCFDNPPLRP